MSERTRRSGTRRPVRAARLSLVLLLAACGLPEGERVPDYEAIFATDRVAAWTLTMKDESWQQLQASPTEYAPADVTVQGVTFEDVGVRLVGNLNRAKLGLRIRFNAFNPAHRFHGVKRVNLRNSADDPTLVREALALQLLRQAGVPAPRSSFVWLDWGGMGGVYTLVEQVDRRFLADRFGENDGNLYRVETGGNLVYRGDDPASYDWSLTYDQRTNEARADHRDLIELMRVLGATAGADRAADLSQVLDVDGLLRALAVNTWLANLDSYAGSARNYYLYRGADGRFRYIPWDLNRAFGNYHGDHCRHAEGEEDCLRFAVAACAEARPEDAEFCAEQLAELCAEHPDEVCRPEFWDVLPAACQTPPPGCDTCRYTTDELLALDPDAPTCSPDRPLVEAVLAVPSFRRRYHDLLAALVDGPLAPAAVEQRLETARALLTGPADLDVWRDAAYDAQGTAVEYGDTFTVDTVTGLQDSWSTRVPGLWPFIRARDTLIREKLGGSPR